MAIKLKPKTKYILMKQSNLPQELKGSGISLTLEMFEILSKLIPDIRSELNKR